MKEFKNRIVWLFSGMALLFAILGFQFAYIQIFEGEKWKEKARRQHYFAAPEPFKRGTFYSNGEIKKGHPPKSERLVVEVEKFHLHIDPVSLPEESHNDIHAFLELEPEMIAEFKRKSRDRLIAMWVERKKRDEILAWWNEYAKEHNIPRNALFFVSDYQRSYPFGKLLGQVLHTVRERRDEETGQAIPTGGLELYFDSYLQGKRGKRLLMRSPRHSLEVGEVLMEPEDGADVYLTIDHYLQAVCEEELEQGAKKVGAKGGWAVMMNPHTGEILALAEYPFFYPEKCREYFNDPSCLESTKVHMISEAFEPGSVMKPLGLILAMMTPGFDPYEKVPCADGKFPGRSKPITDVRTHKFLDMEMGLQKSSNIYMARAAEKCIQVHGDQWYREQLVDLFGFGMKTGLELPGESAGVVPTPGKLHPNGKPEWSKPTPFSLSMGYNLQTTGIQLVRSWALLANQGKLVTPTLVKKIVKGDEVLYEASLIAEPKVDPQIIEQVVRGLRYATLPGGTSSRANIPGFTEVGKSGTARKIIDGQYSKQHHIASFLGFAPAKDPAFVLLVSLDEPEVRYIPGVGYQCHGGVAAAPIFRRIGTRALEYLGVRMDDPHGFPVGDPRYDPDQMEWMPQSRALQEKYKTWNN